ncbi:MAG: hypothetical protein JXR79_09100 [Nitrospirae bacterium]|nr:hypothetical protein [Nitrospirota bacterium]
MLSRFLISFSGTVAIAIYSSADKNISEQAKYAAAFKVCNGLVLATLDTSSNIRPSEIKRAERMVNNLIAGFEPDLSFEPISDEIYEAAGSKVVFLLIQKHFPIVKKGTLSWLIDKALLRAKLSAQREKSDDTNKCSDHYQSADTEAKSAEKYTSDFNDLVNDKFDYTHQLPKGSIKMRIN